MAGARGDEAASEIVDSVRFSFYSYEEIRRISVKDILKPDLLDSKNAPVPEGLYDPSMGPLNDTDSCKTCGQLSARCPGHCGHVEFPKLIYNPLLFKSLQNLLQVTCFYCHKFRSDEGKVKRYASQLNLIINGDIAGARKLEARAQAQIYLGGEMEEVADTSDIEEMNAMTCTWTSLQYTEALSIVSRLMSERRKKCSRCGKNNPKISSPTFGWLNKGMGSSDVRANIISESILNPDDPDQLEDGKLTKKKKMKQFKNDISDQVAKAMMSSGQEHLLPTEAETILKGLWKNEARFCRLLCDFEQKSLSKSQKKRGYRIFFLYALLVPPNKFRPSAVSASMGDLEHPQNILLSKVVESKIALQKAGSTDHATRKWMELQQSVNVLFDSTKGLAKSEKEATGIRQLLEKKSGILRQKMMGKRVNFACRSVISPDPYLAVNEIGIPPYFALRLTYPERVTTWNAKKLRQAIMNGADIHPGATHYKDKESIYKLQIAPNKRRAISKKLLSSRAVVSQAGCGPELEFEGKVVFRHLQNGDIVLVNRQPTLHKPSMMAHVVRVLKGEKTIRMHYANCSTYNADFDGDEMNVHFPQDEVSRAEAVNIVNANRQYIVPTSGNPIRGLIQDHIVSAVLLTKLDTFFSREEYHQLLYAACVPSSSNTAQLHKDGKKISQINLCDKIQPCPPAILKPKTLWTGKQVISAILCHITKGFPPFTIEQKGRIPKEYLREKGKDNVSELLLYIHDNELIKGMIDKAQFGKYGIVHAVQELYGADSAGLLLSMFSRLFTLFLQMHGFTCGVDDLLVSRESDIERKQILDESEDKSESVHRDFTGTLYDGTDARELQRDIEKVIRRNRESATVTLDRMMSSSMNKLTSRVNEVLFPRGLEKPFLRNCLSLMTTTGAKGGSVNMTQISSLLGQQELEGKRVPRMVSGKTLPCFPPWDTSSRSGGFISDRFLTGLRPQEYYFHCMAGRDGLVDTAIKTSRSGYLQRCLVKNLEALKVSYDYTVRDADGSIIQFQYGEDGVDVLKTSFLTQFRALTDNRKVVLHKFGNYLESEDSVTSTDFISRIPYDLKNKASEFLSLPKKEQRCREKIKKKDLLKLLKVKYLSSLADPGESVGVIAAQSIGEPSTQMTLNTFHLAGRGDMNVTLGIPRLQEILMTASADIRTPSMVCPVLDAFTREDAEKVAWKFRRTCVADIIENMDVLIVPFSVKGNSVSTVYKLRMKLYPQELYPPYSKLTLEECQHTLRTVFAFALEDAIEKNLNLLHKINNISAVEAKVETTGSSKVDEDETRSEVTTEGDGVGSDVESDQEGGADAEKKKKQATDEMEYDDGLDGESDGNDDEDAEPQHKLEGRIDLMETEEDYAVGGVSEVQLDEEVPSNPSEVSPSKELGADKVKSEGGKKREKQSLNKTEKQKANKSKKKKTRALLIQTMDLDFEVHYAVDNSEPRILLAEIAQKTAQSIYVRESKNIDRCSVVKDPLSLQTAGVNFEAFWDMDDFLDVKKVISNDIHAMLNTYGVEAARASIIYEVSSVFRDYGIQVNFRHLSLIADFMTANGGYRSLNRIGMGEFSTSPFGKMTFETATKFIVGSAFHGEVDRLEAPSASVCLGQPVRTGTGCFRLMQNLDVGVGR